MNDKKLVVEFATVFAVALVITAIEPDQLSLHTNQSLQIRTLWKMQADRVITAL
jgi:hypothetical protein